MSVEGQVDVTGGSGLVTSLSKGSASRYPEHDCTGVTGGCSRLTCGREALMLLAMQRVYISPGKALCRFCGEQVATNRLSTHIALKHPRPGRIDMTPTLVRKRAAAKRRPSK